jgi:hypothetical protein
MDEVIKSNTLTLTISAVITVIISIIISVIIYFLSRPKSPGIVNVGGFDLSNMNAPGQSSGGTSKGSGDVYFSNKDIGGGDIKGGGISSLDDHSSTSTFNKHCDGLNTMGGC